MVLRAILWLVVVLNAGWGLFALFRPDAAGRIVGLSPEGAAGSGELRAVYGGLVLALAAAIALVLRRPDAGAWPFLLLGLLFGGLVLGRLISLIADGFSGYTLAAIVLEAATGAVLVGAASRLAGGGS